MLNFKFNWLCTICLKIIENIVPFLNIKSTLIFLSTIRNLINYFCDKFLWKYLRYCLDVLSCCLYKYPQILPLSSYPYFFILVVLYMFEKFWKFFIAILYEFSKLFPRFRKKNYFQMQIFFYKTSSIPRFFKTLKINYNLHQYEWFLVFEHINFNNTFSGNDVYILWWLILYFLSWQLYRDFWK